MANSSESRAAQKKRSVGRSRVSARPTYSALARTAVDWYVERSRDFPWRESDDPYVVLVGEVLLQRTRRDLVEPVFRDFIRRWPTFETLEEAPEESVARVIQPLGLPKRATLIKRLAKELVALGKVPTTPEELIELTGIGPYAAHAVPIFALDEHLPVVDWVIARVLRRYFGLPDGGRPNQDRELWRRARTLVRNENARALWLGLLDFAAEICKPQPRCDVCPLNRSCVTGRGRLRARAAK
jgi:A/G-specific adenine glycosylase